MIETLIVIWLAKTLFEVVSDVVLKETALIKGREVEFANGRRFRGRSRGALWGTLTNAAGEVWQTNWSARKSLRAEKARVRADRSAERFRDREKRRADRRRGPDGPELDVPDWIRDPANPARSDDHRPSVRTGSPDRTGPGPDGPGGTGPVRTGTPAPSGPSGPGEAPADQAQPDRGPGSSGSRTGPDPGQPDADVGEPARPDAPQTARPTLTLVKDDTPPEIPTQTAPPRIIEGDAVHSGETSNIDDLTKFLQGLDTYAAQVIASLEIARATLNRIGLTDPGVLGPLAGIGEKLVGIRVDAGNANAGLIPHRNVGEAVSAATGAATSTDFYQPS
ncbi:hypothetical protein [Frankia sp. R82]|uniref:hypothetical protein n=1 Tax=Frankia sp. R82 TaxID=2950553 RepID=UPI00204415EF|nr:hypothetical protein [Frankia sp. R82]MCM3884159.1 hypothetical protein [Frankia sp. R82]